MDELEFRFNLQRFADDPNAGGDNGGQDGGDGGDTGGAGGTGGDGGDKTPTFTPEQQQYIDKLLGQRAKRAETAAAKRALEEMAKAQGFENAKAMEDALRAFKESQEKQKTEAEKLREAKEAAERQAQAAQQHAKQALIQAALMTAAAQAGFADPQDAVRMADTSEIQVADDGTVTGAKEAVEQLARAKPYLVKAGGVASGGAGGNPSRGGPQADQNVERARAEAARRNRGPGAPAGHDPWSSGGQQNVEQIAQRVAAAVAAALTQKE